MDRRDGAALAATIDPDLVLPVHYDTFEEIEADADAFVVDVANRACPWSSTSEPSCFGVVYWPLSFDTGDRSDGASTTGNFEKMDLTLP